MLLAKATGEGTGFRLMGSILNLASLVAQLVKNPPANAGDPGSTLVQEDCTGDGAIKPTPPNY